MSLAESIVLLSETVKLLVLYFRSKKLQRFQNFLARILSSSLFAYSPLGASSSAPLATCPKQNSFQACHHFIQSPFQQLPAIPIIASLIHYHQHVRSLRSSDLPTLSSTNFGSHSFRCSAPAINWKSWNSPQNPLIANHWCLKTQPKNTLLLLPFCPGYLLPVHQIQLISTFARKYQFTLYIIFMLLKYVYNSYTAFELYY